MGCFFFLPRWLVTQVLGALGLMVTGSKLMAIAAGLCCERRTDEEKVRLYILEISELHWLLEPSKESRSAQPPWRRPGLRGAEPGHPQHSPAAFHIMGDRKEGGELRSGSFPWTVLGKM